jgi:MtN3 and saliva related transmembrane protein
MTLDSVLETSATLVGIFSSFAMFPQVYRIFKRKSAKDLSILTYTFLFAAGIVWVLYGVNIQSSPLIITNFLGVLNLLGILIGWFLYGKESAEST